MDITNPENGSTSNTKKMYYGAIATGITNYTCGVSIDENGVPYKATTTNSLLPKEDGTYPTGKYNHAPNPYLPDGSKNPIFYYNTVVDGVDYTGNALTDVNGYENTQWMCEHATYQPNWRHDVTITNASSNGCYPAACCCWRYHTIGTRHGQWYLPAAGEFAYYYVKKVSITATFNLLASKNVPASAVSDLMSSTRYNNTYRCSISNSGHYLNRQGSRTTNQCVRPYLKLSPQECC